MTQNEQLTFSPLQPAHIDQMAQIEIECFSVPWSREALEEELENPYAHYVVCCDPHGNVMGYIGSRIVLDEADITNVAVRPQYRRPWSSEYRSYRPHGCGGKRPGMGPAAQGHCGRTVPVPLPACRKIRFGL